MKKSKPSNDLSQALEFLSLCQSDTGSDMATHCMMANYNAVAFDGVLAVGTGIQEDLIACPHTRLMALALARCGESYTITHLPENRLRIASGDFDATIPCLDAERLTAAIPDAPQAGLSDDLRAALRVVTPLVAKDGLIVTAAVQLHSSTALATDRDVILEAWHGIDGLPSILVPKIAAKAILKCKKPLLALGWSDRTATFWFENNSWLRTQLYIEDVPDLRTFLRVNASDQVPSGFFEAVKKISPFSENGRVYCGDGKISSHLDEVGGRLSLEVPGFNSRVHYSIKGLKLIEKHTDKLQVLANNITVFNNSSVRGAIYHGTVEEINDDDIPF